MITILKNFMNLEILILMILPMNLYINFKLYQINDTISITLYFINITSSFIFILHYESILKCIHSLYKYMVAFVKILNVNYQQYF